MRWISIVAVVSILGIGVGLRAEECCQAQAKLKALETRIAKLVTGWNAAGQQHAAWSAQERAEFAAQLKAATSSCPIGSRMGDTLNFVQRALTAAIDAEKRIEASCTANAAKAGGECDAKLREVVLARAKLMKSLEQLTSLTLGAMDSDSTTVVSAQPKAGFCAESLAAKVRSTKCDKSAAKLLTASVPGLSCEKSATQLVSAVKGAGCDKSAAALISKAAKPAPKAACEEAPASACKTASSCGAFAKLQASWAKAGTELASMSKAHSTALQSKFGALAQRSKAVQLFPETTAVLVEGLALLDTMNKHLEKQVSSNGAVQRSMPKQAAEAFASQVKSLREAHEILSAAGKLFQVPESH